MSLKNILLVISLGITYSVINYAKENKMILVTRDTESGQACDENSIPCILLIILNITGWSV